MVPCLRGAASVVSADENSWFLNQLEILLLNFQYFLISRLILDKQREVKARARISVHYSRQNMSARRDVRARRRTANRITRSCSPLLLFIYLQEHKTDPPSQICATLCRLAAESPTVVIICSRWQIKRSLKIFDALTIFVFTSNLRFVVIRCFHIFELIT